MEDLSITGIKANFIRAQVRQLSAPLEPTLQAQDLVDDPEDGRFSDKAMQDIVSKVNDKIRQHNRSVYSQQSQRHVAEQIETLHWNQVGHDEDLAELDTVIIRRDANLTEAETVASLPENYADLHINPNHKPEDQDAQEYRNSRKRLVELSRERDALRQRLAQYKQLQTMLAPLRDPQTNVQSNLVSRDGELSTELDRMRVLLARVTARVSDMGDAPHITAPESTSRPLTKQQLISHLMQTT